jgi:hypothetical protein
MSEILSAAKFETMAIDVAYGGPAAPLCASHEALRAERDAAARITRESRRRETEQRARAGNAEKSVRVLTEALALLLAGVETGHFNTAIDDARSVLASVPFGERFTDCKWAAPSEPKRIESPNPLTPTFVFVPSEPSMKCPTCGSEDRAERLCVKCESIRLGFMARVEHDRLTCPDSFHSVLSEPTVCPTCGGHGETSDGPTRTPMVCATCNGRGAVFSEETTP